MRFSVLLSRMNKEILSYTPSFHYQKISKMEEQEQPNARRPEKRPA
jgi:hypothetical protein